VNNLPTFLQDVLESCPSAGSGVNHWLFTTGRQLHAHMDEQTMFSLLKERSRHCGRPVQDKEIARQITCSRQSAWRPRGADVFPHANGIPIEIKVGPSAPKWPDPDLELIRRIVACPFRLEHMRDLSPIKLSLEEPSHTETIIDAVWPGDPLLCCGLEMYKFATRRREKWRGNLARYALIVPNPMLRVKGLTQEDKVSEHTLDATAARVYQVIEFDFAEFADDGVTETLWTPLIREWQDQGITVSEACAALHLHLSVARDLVLVCHSGGKSLHGWYACFDRTEEENREFMIWAVRLGADRQTWVRSQFVRMPDGTRNNGKRQTIYYFDPDKAVKA
jgi:hypothetical protein